MTEKTSKKLFSLTDSDIVSKVALNRRSMLATAGRAVGAAAVAVGAMIASTNAAHASSDKANTYDNDSHDRRPSTDND